MTFHYFGNGLCATVWKVPVSPSGWFTFYILNTF